MTIQATLWCAAAGFAASAVGASLAERRRNRRRDLDAVGWVSWPLVQVLSLMLAVCAAVVALH